MGLLKPRKNKKFGYEPRYFDNNGEGNPYQIEHKFDKFRTTVETKRGLKHKFIVAWEDFKASSDKKSNKRVLFIIAILILMFLFIIEFDLSIFFN
ncbi:MAG: riboflavin synthase subunit beta [Bacteroidetes bacterium]|nr:riboflavin synthase subunit beta [Bacteroidota bacterium]